MAVIKRPGQTTFSAITTQNLQDVNGDALPDPAFYAYDAGTVVQPGVTMDGRNLVGGVLTDTGSDDIIIGGEGDDNLNGYTGNDILRGGAGNDIVGGGKGNDVVYGDAGNDTLRGALGDDMVYGGDGDDLLDESNDTSLTAKNVLVGNQGNDIILGGSGADDIQGGQGNDVLIGNLGDDIIRAGRGEDVVLGGAGNDTIYLGDNGDISNAVDLVVFNVREGKSDGNDTVFNFAQGVDKIQLVDYDNAVNLTSTTVYGGSVGQFTGDAREVASILGNTVELSNGTIISFQGLAQVYWDDFFGVTAPTFSGDVFGEGSTFAADVAGFNPANVVIEATEPLTVAQAAQLVAQGYSLNNLTYSIQDYFTNIQAAQGSKPLLLSSATGVTALGDELGQTMSFAAFNSDVNLTVVANEGDDLIQAGKGNDDIIGGQGADRVQLTTLDQSADDVIYTSSDDGASFSTARAEFGGVDADYREGGILSLNFNGEAYSYTIGQGDDSFDTRDSVLSNFANWLQNQIDVDASDYVVNADNGVVSIRTTGFGDEAAQIEISRAQLDVDGTASTYTASFNSTLGTTLTEAGQLSLTFKDQSGTTHVITTDVVWVPEQPNPPIPGQPIFGGEDGLVIIGYTPGMSVPPTPGYVNLQASVEALEDAIDVALGGLSSPFTTQVVSDGAGGYKLNITLTTPFVNASDEVYELVDYSYALGDQFDTGTDVDVATTAGTNQTTEDITATATVTTVAFSDNLSDYVVDAKLQVTLKDGPDTPDTAADVISYTITQADVDAAALLSNDAARLNYYMGKLADAFTSTSATATATTVNVGTVETPVMAPGIELTAVDAGSSSLSVDTTGSATGISYGGVDYSYEMVFTSEASAYAAGNEIKVYLGDLYAGVNSDNIQNGTFTYTVKANSEYNGGVFTSTDKAYLIVQDLKEALAAEIVSANLSPALHVDLVGDGLKSGATPAFDIDDRSISFTLDNSAVDGPQQPGQALVGLSGVIETNAFTNVVSAVFDAEATSTATFDFGAANFDLGDVVTLRVPFTIADNGNTKTFGVQYTVGQNTIRVDVDGNGAFNDLSDTSFNVTPATTANGVMELFAKALTRSADITLDEDGAPVGTLTNVFENITDVTLGQWTSETLFTLNLTATAVNNTGYIWGTPTFEVVNSPAVVPSGIAVLVTQTGRDDVAAFVTGEDVSETEGLDDSTADSAAAQESTVDFSGLTDLFEGQTLTVTINTETYSVELAGGEAIDLDEALASLITAINADSVTSGVTAAAYNDDGKIVLTGSIDDNTDTGAQEGSDAYDLAISFTVTAGAETRTQIVDDLQTVNAEDGIDRDTSDGTLDVVNRYYGDEEFGTPGSDWDVVTGFQIGNDNIVIGGDLYLSTVDGNLNYVQADSNFNSNDDFDLDTYEFGVLNVQGAINGGLTSAASIAALLEGAFNLESNGNDNTLNTSVFAVTSSTNVKQTAIWVHTQSSADDTTISADELQLLSVVNSNATTGDRFDFDNLDAVAPPAPEGFAFTEGDDDFSFFGYYYDFNGNSANQDDWLTELNISTLGGDDDIRIDVNDNDGVGLTNVTVDLGAGNDRIELDMNNDINDYREVTLTLGDGVDVVDTYDTFEDGLPTFSFRVTDFNVNDDRFEDSNSNYAVMTSIDTAVVSYNLDQYGNSATDVFEFAFEASDIGGVDFADVYDANGTITGAQLLQALGDGVDVATLTLDQQGSNEGFLVTYNSNDAFVFAFDDNGDGAVAADEIQLMGVLDNVAMGSMTTANFGLI